MDCSTLSGTLRNKKVIVKTVKKDGAETGSHLEKSRHLGDDNKNQIIKKVTKSSCD